MRFYATIIIIFLLLTGCSNSTDVNSTNENLVDKGTSVAYTDTSSTLNNSFIKIKPDNSGIAFLTNESHQSTTTYCIFFSNFKSYESLDLLTVDNKLKVYYFEDDSKDIQDVSISFNLDFDPCISNIEIYKNNNKIDNNEINFILGME